MSISDNKPAISVVLPVYNAERYLGSAIASILWQKFDHFELIVVNDGSTDRSLAIAEEAASRDSRVRIVSQRNQGIVTALNHGLSLATGEWIARMDGDDLAMPSRFELQTRFLTEHPECVAVGTQVIFIDPDGDEIGPKLGFKKSHQDIDGALMAGEWPIVHPTIMMRTSVVRDIGGYREFTTWEDHDLFLRLAERGTLANLEEPLLKYRLHMGSIVHQRSTLRSNVLARVLEEARTRRREPESRVSEAAPYRVLRPVEHRRNWGWWALSGGNVSTARKHALGGLWQAPHSLDSWRLFYCAMRGR